MIAIVSRDRRIAERLLDLASALQAGLPLAAALDTTLGNGAGGALDGPVARLLGKRLGLSATEVMVLEAAERSGRLEKALRSAAAARNARASLLAATLARLAYPVLLLGISISVGLFVKVIFEGHAGKLWLTLAAVAAALGGLAVWLFRAVRHGTLDAARIPVLGPWLAELAEISYLQALHGLYGAGVPIRTAVAEAARVPPFALTRTRTMLASTLVAEGSSLAESYERSRALHPESQRLLAAAERAGDLEEALERTLRRRQDSFDARSKRLCAGLVVVVSGLAFATAGYVILSFYGSYYGALAR